jgi:chemotaxis protein MotA
MKLGCAGCLVLTIGIMFLVVVAGGFLFLSGNIFETLSRIRFIADGYDTNFIRDNLERDRDNFLTHLDEGQKIYRAIGDCAPAFGMIGTLLGMVQMFANMTDPSKLGPFMATALLATLYGAVVANLWCLPLADKLHLKLAEEEINRTLIIDGVLMIREAKSPTLVREMLLAYLPEKHRHDLEPEAVPA